MHRQGLRYDPFAIDPVKAEQAVAIAHELRLKAGAEVIDDQNRLAGRLGHAELGGSDFVIAPFTERTVAPRKAGVGLNVFDGLNDALFELERRGDVAAAAAVARGTTLLTALGGATVASAAVATVRRRAATARDRQAFFRRTRLGARRRCHAVTPAPERQLRAEEPGHTNP